MAYVTPTSKTTGDLIAATDWNQNTVENVKYFKDAPTFDGAVTMSSTLTLAGVFTINTVGTHLITGASNAAQTLSLRNTTSGTAGKVEHLLTAGTAVGRLATFSQGFTTSGVSQLSSTLLEAQGAGGLSVAASHASGAIRFYSGGTTERGRFETNGYFGLNETSLGAYLSVSNDPAVASGFRFSATGSGSGTIGAFRSVTTQVGSITVTGSATSYNTSSDRRLKTDCGLAIDISGLRALQIHEFVWTNTQTADRGVFAQEALATHPRAVHVGTDETDDDGVSLKNPWSVDYSKFVPDLIVGWQQHDATIAQLAARIAALEGRQ